MIKVIRWLIGLAEKKPIIFGVALLLIGVSITGYVIVYQQKRIVRLEEEKRIMSLDYDKRIDSLSVVSNHKIEELNKESKETLRSMIQDYKDQLKEQQQLNRKINNSIQTNDEILRKNQQKLKQLDHDY